MNLWLKFKQSYVGIRDLMKKRRAYVENLSIKSKIIMFFSITTILVFGSLLVYINFNVKPRNEDNIKFLISQNVETKASEVSMWIEKRVVEYRTLSTTPAVRSMDVREITPIIESVTNSHKNNEETMETFSFIGKNGFCWINSKATENLIKYEDYMLVYSEDKEFIIGQPVLNDNNREVILFYYPIEGYTGKKESLICSAVPLVRLKEIVNTAQLYGSKTWIMNRQGDIITTDLDYFYDNYVDEEMLKTIDFESIVSSDMISLDSLKGDSTLFVSPVTSYPDWVLCTLTTDSAINHSINEMLIGYLFLFGALILLIIFIGAYVTKSVLNPIKILQSCMSRVEAGQLDAYYNTSTAKDEIYYLGVSYNKMLDEITQLIDKIYEEQSERRMAELRILQEQIKPHFLYNTLDNIKWMAKKQGANDVAKTITDLSNFFRVFLNNGNEKITLKQEFRHTRSYLDIQKTRCGEKLDYVMDIEKEIEEVSIIKILIQPIVENSIYHGIKTKESKGNIFVKAYSEGGYIKVTVEDDGIGMDDECLNKLRESLLKAVDSGHYGMKNILQRLKYAYGDNACLNIESKLGVGTKVTILIPRQGEEECIER